MSFPSNHGQLVIERLPAYPELRRLWAVLPRARLVGGAVRDLALGVDVADVDLATPEPPEAVMKILADAGIRTVPTGLSHGTVTAVLNGRGLEITTLRRDEETDGRHAVVSWTTDWREDAARRDFTINALSCDSDGMVHDYFGGLADLAAGRVRFVGDPGERIREDALRVLRFFRFQGRFGGDEADPGALFAIRAMAGRVRRLSVERVWSEFRRILRGPRADDMVMLMAETGVLQDVLPELVARGGAAEVRAAAERLTRLIASGAPREEHVRLAALLWISPSGDAATGGDLAEGAVKRLRLSRADQERVRAILLALPMTPSLSDAELRRAAADTSVTVLVDRVWLDQALMAESQRRGEAPDGLSSGDCPRKGGQPEASLDDAARPVDAVSQGEWSAGASSKVRAQPGEAGMAEGPDANAWATLRSRLSRLRAPAFPLAGRDVVALGVAPGAEVGRILAETGRWWRMGGCLADRDECLAWASQLIEQKRTP
ncbi:CCA tRNA nucleotidyltransferase [Acetobacter sacchari]|uniref:CCA tRNA nucleotidyltransferase n=1 Tax=Acetobacter sacchari TaxID=2661687 RepID=A0ABS3LZ94_9PROT|nr:CCA tRNA nucleotidyltransferase [Acetobacter sacchari]MBO1361229.1 CCA tRNA nucleotidyltransferase [Acetobacter sacchari]